MRHLLIAFMAVLLAAMVSCGDKEKSEEIHPYAYFEDETLYPGDVAIIGGRFYIDPAKLTFTIEGQAYPFKVVSESSISFVVPDLLGKFETSRDVNCSLSAIYEGEKKELLDNFIIDLKIPETGWFYQKKLPYSSVSALSVLPDGTLCLTGNGVLQQSSDAGLKWLDVTNSYQDLRSIYGGMLINKNTGWFVARLQKYFYYLNGNFEISVFTPDLSPLVTKERGAIVQLWLDAYNSGLLVFERGSIVGIDDFSGRIGSVNSIYESSGFQRLTKLSATNKYEFVVSGSSPGNSIIFKSENESPVVYDVPEEVSQIKLLKNQDIYYCNQTTGNFYKITWPFHVEKLEQKATLFHWVNALSGYAIFENVVYKTTDGAQTWTSEFTIDSELTPESIVENKGHVWISSLWVTETGQQTIILKYNPLP